MVLKNETILKIDLKDKKLLYYLSLDSRMSYTQLAKKVMLSKNAVKYRIERLKLEGVIKNFASVINLGALGFTTFTLFLKFNEDIYKNKKIINYFKNHEFSDWVISLSGQWDLFVEFVCFDINHMFKIIDGIVDEFNENLNTYEVLFSKDTLKVEHLINDFYQELKLNNIPIKERSTFENKIDKTDKRILNLLAQDSALTFPQIADKLRLTLDIVRYRVKNLIEKNIIVKFFPEISLSRLGYTEYLYILKLKNISSNKLNSLRQDIKLNNNVTYAFFDKLALSLVFVCAFKDSNGIDSLSRGLRNEYSDMIDNQEYLIIKEQILFNLYPQGLINL